MKTKKGGKWHSGCNLFSIRGNDCIQNKTHHEQYKAHPSLYCQPIIILVYTYILLDTLEFIWTCTSVMTRRLIFADNYLHSVGHRCPHSSKVLVVAHAFDLDPFVVDEQAFVRVEGQFTDPDCGLVVVDVCTCLCMKNRERNMPVCKVVELSRV